MTASVGLTWNCDIRDNGTAFLCRSAFERMRDRGEISEAKHYRPFTSKPSGHDFYFYCDDGRDDLEWIPPHPNAYWAIDTHLGYDYRVWKARQFDRAFVAQKDAVAQFKRDGVKHVEWLPLACDPERHPSAEELKARDPNCDVSKAYDVAFVGFLSEEDGPGYNNRVAYLDALFKALPNSWLSTGVFHEAMAMRYVRACVGFNVSIKNDLNMRVFEVLSTGTPLLTNRGVEGLDDLFPPEENCMLTYSSPGEAIEKAKWAVGNASAANDLGDWGQELVRRKHTYEHRMQHVTEVMSHV